MPPRPPARRVLAALGCAALAGAVAPAPALGHAAFVGANPAPGARVEQAPARVVVEFSEPLQRSLSTAELRRSGGGRVAARRSVEDRRIVLTPRARLVRGAYEVRWQTVSTDDAHPLEGSFGFGVGVQPEGAGSVEQNPLAGGGWLRALFRAGLYAMLLLFAGGLLVRALVGAAWPGQGDERVRRRADELLVDAGLATVSFGVAVAVVESSLAADGLSASALGDYLLSGLAGFARVALIALAALAVALVRRAPRGAALCAAGALACVTASGHANSADPRALATIADLVHLLAGAVWLGGAGLLVLAWAPSLRDAGGRARVWREVAPGFGRVALVAFGVVVVAGTVNAVIELDRVSDLWETAYGRVLAVKVTLVALVAGLAYLHAYRLRGDGDVERRRWAVLRAEPLAGLAVVAAAGLLVAFPLPPRQLSAATGAQRIAACDPCPLPAAQPGELAVAAQAGTRVVAAWVRPAGGALTGTVRVLDFRGRPARGAVTVPGARGRPCGAGCLRLSVTPAPGVLTVAVTERGRGYTVRLPARWRRGNSPQARRLLRRAEETMRALGSVRESERVSSGPGQVALARYALRAPDRLAYVTARGLRTIQIARRQWVRTPGSPWIERPVSGGAPFRTRSWFRWTPYARTVELLDERREAGRRVAELAFADPATPVWARLVVELETSRVLRERLVAPARDVAHRFFGFNSPVEIEPPL